MLGERLKQLRADKTQEEIANLLGISRARYSHYENDRVQPDNELLQKMAKLFDISIDYLLDNKANEIRITDRMTDLELQMLDMLLTKHKRIYGKYPY